MREAGEVIKGKRNSTSHRRRVDIRQNVQNVNPLTMPKELVKAHQSSDRAIARAYGGFRHGKMMKLSKRNVLNFLLTVL